MKNGKRSVEKLTL